MRVSVTAQRGLSSTVGVRHAGGSREPALHGGVARACRTPHHGIDHASDNYSPAQCHNVTRRYPTDRDRCTQVS